MEDDKKIYGDDVTAGVHSAGDVEYNRQGGNEDFYDPSLESKWTRAGLNWESFKRAPGTTR
jgi:amino acid transporter